MLSRLFIAAVISTIALPAHATRWFEVEFIAFEQKANPELREDFSIKYPEITGKNQLDLLTDGFNLAGKDQCLQGSIQRQKNVFEPQSQVSPVCPDSYDYTQYFDVMPLSPKAEIQEHTDNLYLLDESQLQLDEVMQKLKRKGLKPILHTGWRFPESSQTRAPNIIVYGGKRFVGNASLESIKNYINSEGYVGLLNHEFDSITHKDPDLWQLQGLMKIHVRHYLFITSEFDYRFMNDDAELQTARFSQYTRVYSGDIHYLDHPKMGMIIQIRKYKH
ncbi:peptidoglycan binding protein CsiV [Pseudoalteromonas xiamenensis]|uniref:CsiV family protein n=1 Tax=Pseudoalteromonas xiamenensis TaxID=882626 RepID=UPI0027E58A39|nr:CsiV family protein [Pseudoalteromonas xiamenensis]WMN60114.1 peptidoglycan binding protein CsiV [Pseudoalteromonas xiamenensis]